MPIFREGTSYTDRRPGSTAVARSKSSSPRVTGAPSSAIYRTGNSFSDRPPGTTGVAGRVSSLARRPKTGKEPLPAAPAPQEIPEVRNVAERTTVEDTGFGGGIASPLTETEHENNPGFHSFTSSDGVFVIIIQQETRYLDGVGQELIIKHRGPDA
jgi:hypothetical protein